MEKQVKDLMRMIPVNMTSAKIPKLQTICGLIKLDIDEETANLYEPAIINAYESAMRCKSCKLTPFEAHQIDCYKSMVEVVGGKVYQTACICEKVLTHLKALSLGKIIENTGIGKRFRQRTFDNFKVDNDNKKVFTACKSFCDNFKNDTKGIMLCGGYGVGKTHLAAAILNKLVENNIVGAFVVVPDLLRVIRQSFDDKDNQELKTLFDTVKNAELLVLDDLGSQKSNEWVKEQLFILINSRYENMLPTIITTNLTLDELAREDNLGQRIVSRLREMTVQIFMNGNDKRNI